MACWQSLTECAQDRSSARGQETSHRITVCTHCLLVGRVLPVGTLRAVGCQRAEISRRALPTSLGRVRSLFVARRTELAERACFVRDHPIFVARGAAPFQATVLPRPAVLARTSARGALFARRAILTLVPSFSWDLALVAGLAAASLWVAHRAALAVLTHSIAQLLSWRTVQAKLLRRLRLLLLRVGEKAAGDEQKHRGQPLAPSEGLFTRPRGAVVPSRRHTASCATLRYAATSRCARGSTSAAWPHRGSIAACAFQLAPTLRDHALAKNEPPPALFHSS